MSPVKNIPQICHHWNSSLFSSMHSLKGSNFPPFSTFKCLFPLHHLLLSVALIHIPLQTLSSYFVKDMTVNEALKVEAFIVFFFQYSVYYKAWRWYVCNHFICLTLCNLMDCSLPGSSVHEIFLTRILACVVISSSRGSCWPRDQTSVSCIARGFFFFLPLSHLGSPKMVYFLVFCFTDQTICYVSKTKDSFKWCH